jgi:ABC-type phosphate transport system substrate-binding protein
MRRRITTVLIGVALLGGAAAAGGSSAQAAPVRTFVTVNCSNGVSFNVDSRVAPLVARVLTYFNAHNQSGVTCSLATVGPPAVGPPG